MIDATWVGDALRLLPLLFIGAFVLLLGLALVVPRRPLVKAGFAVAVIAAFGYQHWSSVRYVEQRQAEVAQQRAEFEARLRPAQALFDERCKSAGERIHRSVENVDGVVWMKWRPKSVNLDSQYTLDDPYGGDCGGEDCILKLLRVSKDADKYAQGAARHKGVYRFVETEDPRDGRKYRYIAAIKAVRQRSPEQRELAAKNNSGVDPGPNVYDVVLEREPIERFSARYGITWDDISTREDRDHWVAGGSLKVLDLQTNEVIAERVGYMMDRGLGSRAGFRSPWGFAVQNACPPFPSNPGDSY